MVITIGDDVVEYELEDTDDGTGQKTVEEEDNDITTVSKADKKKKKKKKGVLLKVVRIKVKVPKWHQKPLLKQNLKKGIKRAVCGLVLVVILDLAFNLLVLITGAVHLHHCPLQPLLPIWLVVVGVIGLLSLLVTCYSGYKQVKMPKETCHVLGAVVLIGFWSFWLSWLISGNIWVFSSWRHYHSFQTIENSTTSSNDASSSAIPESSHYCNKVTFELSAGWVITLDVIVICALISSIYALIIYKTHLRRQKQMSEL